LIEFFPYGFWSPTFETRWDLLQDANDNDFFSIDGVLAFENSIRKDYITEKLFDNLTSGVIPVVWGWPQAGDYLPGGPGSFINALNFRSAASLAEYLVELDNDDEKYLSYFDWRYDLDKINQKFLDLANHNCLDRGETVYFARLVSCIIVGFIIFGKIFIKWGVLTSSN
jgi:hypothetical protein